MSRHTWRERTVVYLVTTEQGFVPDSPWSVPSEFSGGTLHLRNVTLSDARACVRALNAGAMRERSKSPDTWNRRWAVATACCRNKGWDANEHARESSEVSRHPRDYTADEIARLLAACAKAPLPIIDSASPSAWWSAFLQTILTSGLRPTVALKLCRADIDGVTSIHLPEETKALCKVFLDARNANGSDDLVFPWPHNGKTLTLTFQGLLQAAGIGAAHGLHGLRRFRLGRTVNVSETPKPLGYTTTELARLLSVADNAALPIVAGRTPGQWWRSLITAIAVSGLRYRKLAAMRLSELPDAVTAIALGMPNVEFPFAWPHDEQEMLRTFNGLLVSANIETGRGLHGLRHTCAASQRGGAA